MTVVEIAVDLIRERDQLRKRIEQQQEVLRTQLLRTEELTRRISNAKEILPDVGNDIVREALWNALEGK